MKGLIVGAEAVDSELIEKWHSGRNMVNCYGPTEATICSSFDKLEVGAAPTLGRPVAGNRMYILDQHLHMLPAGSVGEIYIGGQALAQGYQKQSALTAERFIPDPFSAQGGRMYRTGDLGRFTDGGKISFLGRNDDQVKIRGFRIELGEIEARIKQLPHVELACALVFEQDAFKELIAFYVPAEHQEEQEYAIRQALEKSLPPYMIPASIWALDELPLTPTGKVDKRALLQLAAAWRTERDVEDDPEGETEQAMAHIWQELLALPKISRTSNFFALGGHSLLATRMQESILVNMGIQLELGDIYQARDLASLAMLAKQQEALDAEEHQDLEASLMEQIDGMSEEEIERLLAQQDDGE